MAIQPDEVNGHRTRARPAVKGVYYRDYEPPPPPAPYPTKSNNNHSEHHHHDTDDNHTDDNHKDNIHTDNIPSSSNNNNNNDDDELLSHDDRTHPRIVYDNEYLLRVARSIGKVSQADRRP